jgi:transposase
MVEAGIHRLRTGCQWCALPREFGAPSTAFTWHQRFCQDGLYLAFWQATLLIARVLATVYLTWLSCDTVFAKAPVKGGTGTGPNPTDRAKQGVKRSLLVDQCGGPLAVIVAPANVHDSKLLENTLSSALVPRCTGAKNRTSHVCLDKC